MRRIHGPIACALVAVVLSSSAAGQHRTAMPPPPTRVQQLQLSRPFTLTYRASARVFLDGSYRPYRLRLTLSYDGKRLLYRTEYIPIPGSPMTMPVTITKLFDGRETYTAESNSRIAMIHPGFDAHRDLRYCPLPGVGIPHVPLMTHGIPPDSYSEARRTFSAQLASEAKLVAPSLYRTPNLTRDIGSWTFDGRASRTRPRSHFGSIATVQSAGAPKALWYDTFDNPAPSLGTLWEFFRHRRFAGVWLATKLKKRHYGIQGYDAPNRLLQEVTYELESAREGPLEASAYDPATYLPQHANVTDNAGPSVRTFLYEPGQGSLQEQRARGTDARYLWRRGSGAR